MTIIKQPHIAVLTLELHIPAAQSLKDRRRVIKSIKERISARYNISVAEVGDTKKWQTATLGFAAIGNSKRHLEQTLQIIIHKIDHWRMAEIIAQQIEFL